MRSPSANTARITTSACPGTIIETRLGLASSAQRSAVLMTAFASASGAGCQWADMAVVGNVGIAGGVPRSLDPSRARGGADEQKFVMQISAEPEQLAVDLGHPFPGLGPGRNRRRVIPGIGKVLRDSLRRCGHAVERVARIEAVVQIKAR